MVAIFALAIFATAAALGIGAILVVSPKLQDLPENSRARADRVENYAIGAVALALLLAAVAGGMVN
jgi:hypothetical protein